MLAYFAIDLCILLFIHCSVFPCFPFALLAQGLLNPIIALHPVPSFLIKLSSYFTANTAVYERVMWSLEK